MKTGLLFFFFLVLSVALACAHAPRWMWIVFFIFSLGVPIGMLAFRLPVGHRRY